MTYVLIIISLVAMGGPKNTTPTIDHMEFASEAACTGAADFITGKLSASKIRAVAKCLPK